jgi:glycosyltransferase involved in cell wall biosynthesis
VHLSLLRLDLSLQLARGVFAEAQLDLGLDVQPSEHLAHLGGDVGLTQEAPDFGRDRVHESMACIHELRCQRARELARDQRLADVTPCGQPAPQDLGHQVERATRLAWRWRRRVRCGGLARRLRRAGRFAFARALRLRRRFHADAPWFVIVVSRHDEILGMRDGKSQSDAFGAVARPAPGVEDAAHMADVLLVSKPIVPPWHDSSKNLVRDLAMHMHRHTPIVLSQPGARLDMPRARVEPIYSASARGFSPALRDNARVLRRLLLARPDELWHFFFAPNPRTSIAARVASRVRRARTLQTVCSAPHANASLGTVLFADRIVVLSEHTRRRFVDAGVECSRLRLIRPAVPALTPLPAGRVADARLRLGLPVARPLVVYPGDLEFGRGAELALYSVADAPKSLDACLVMACREKTQRARERAEALRAQASALGIAERVIWFGETPFIHDLLAVADVVSLPADTLYAKMDLPLVVMEAMALARAVIVGRGTSAEELAQGGGALAVEPERAAVSAATAALLEDAARRAELGATAREVTRREYDARRMTAAYEVIYDELGGRAGT